MPREIIDTFRPITKMNTGAYLYFGSDALARLRLALGDKVNVFRETESGDIVLQKVGDPLHCTPEA